MTTPMMKCTKRADLLALPAVMFGFHPTESCVFMGMRGKTVSFTARVDLDWHLHEAEPLIEQLLSAADSSGSDEWILLGYSAEPDLAFLSVSEAAAALGVESVREALATDGHHFWSLDDGEPETFSFEHSSVAAQAVYEGRVIAANRDGAVAAVEERCPATREQLDEMLTQLPTTGEGRHRLVSELLESVAPLDPEKSLKLALLLADEDLADEVVSTLTIDRAERVWPQLVGAHRVAPDAVEVGPLAVLAMASWLRGGGAEYTSCLEQLNERAPAHPVTLTLRRMHELGIPPKMWNALE